MAATEPRAGPQDAVRWGEATQAMFRAAQAVSHSGGPTLFDDLLRELAEILEADAVFVAIFADDSRRTLRTLAARLDGRALRNFDFPLDNSPCAQVVGRAFRYVPRGVAAEFAPGSIFGVKGMDAYAAFPLVDSAGAPLGVLAAMDRRPIGGPMV